MSVTNQIIKCCSAKQQNIVVYSPMGEHKLLTVGESGSKQAGQFNYPLISDDDSYGTLLIADNDNNRIQVLTCYGGFSVLKLCPQVSQPRSVVLLNNHLYVTSVEKQTLAKYSCNIQLRCTSWTEATKQLNTECNLPFSGTKH